MISYAACILLTTQINDFLGLGLLVHTRSTSLPQLSSLLTLLMHTLSQQLRVLVRSILGGLRPSSLECKSVSLVLDALGCDESLDLGGFGVWFGAFFLGGDFSTDDKLALTQLVYYAFYGRLV